MSSNYDTIYKYLSSQGSSSTDKKLVALIKDDLERKRNQSLSIDEIIHKYRILLSIAARCETLVDYDNTIKLLILCVCNPLYIKEIESILVNEIILLGKVLVIILDFLNSNKKSNFDCLENCNIKLPISNITISPEKCTLLLTGSAKILNIFNCWCETVCNCLKYNKLIPLSNLNSVIIQSNLLLCSQSEFSKLRIGICNLVNNLNESNSQDQTVCLNIVDKCLSSVVILINEVTIKSDTSVHTFKYLLELIKYLILIIKYVRVDLFGKVLNKSIELVISNVIEKFSDLHINKELSTLAYNVITDLNTFLLEIIIAIARSENNYSDAISLNNIIKLINYNNYNSFHKFNNIAVLYDSELKELSDSLIIKYSNDKFDSISFDDTISLIVIINDYILKNSEYDKDKLNNLCRLISKIINSLIDNKNIIIFSNYQLGCIFKLLYRTFMKLFERNLNINNDLKSLVYFLMKTPIINLLNDISDNCGDDKDLKYLGMFDILSVDSFMTQTSNTLLKLLVIPINYEMTLNDKIFIYIPKNKLSYIPKIMSEVLHECFDVMSKNYNQTNHLSLNKLIMSSINLINTIMIRYTDHNDIIPYVITVLGKHIATKGVILSFKSSFQIIELLLKNNNDLPMAKILSYNSTLTNQNDITMLLLSIYFHIYLIKHNLNLYEISYIIKFNETLSNISPYLTLCITIAETIITKYMPNNQIQPNKTIFSFLYYYKYIIYMNSYVNIILHNSSMNSNNNITNKQIDEYILSVYLSASNNLPSDTLNIISNIIELSIISIAFNDTFNPNYRSCEDLFIDYNQLFNINKVSYDYSNTIKIFTNIIPVCCLINSKVLVYILNYFIKVWVNCINADQLSVLSKATIYSEMKVLASSEVLGLFFLKNINLICDEIIWPYIKDDNSNNIELQATADVIGYFISLSKKSSPLCNNIDITIAQYLMIKIYFMIPAKAQRLVQLLPEAIHGEHQKQSLLERIDFLYELLISSYLQKFDTYNLIYDNFYNILKEISKLYNLKFIDLKDKNILSDGIIQRTLVNLTWDLGFNNDIRREQCMNGLKIFCSLAKYHLWQVPRYINEIYKKDVNFISQENEDVIMEDFLFDENKEVEVKVNIQKNISQVLGDHFLYINSRIQSNWIYKTSFGQAHSLRVMKEIIGLLSVIDIIKYIPKINTIVNLSLFNPFSIVQSIGLEICNILLAKVKLSQLIDHLSDLIVPIFDLIDNLYHKMKYFKENSLNIIITNNFNDIKNSKENVNKNKEINDIYIPYHKQIYNIPGIVLESFDIKAYEAYSIQYNLLLYDNAINIINNIFKINKNDTSMLLTTIPFIPNIPELHEILMYQSEQISQLTLEELLNIYQLLLRHELIIVRQKALEKIYNIINKNLKYFYEIIQNNQEKIIKKLIIDLFQLCIYEKETSVLVLVSKCLGAIGAIEPSIISIGKIQKSTNNNNKSIDKDQPWEFSIQDISLYIVETYLLPSLRSNSLTQTVIGFALQEILDILSPKIIENDSIAPKMSDELMKLLINRKIYDLLEPFWLSKYVLKNSSDKDILVNNMIYSSNITYSKWISRWIKKLLYLCDNKTLLSKIYDSCRGALMLKNDLCTYLLPRVLIEALSISQNDKNSNHRVYYGIISEIISVLCGQVIIIDHNTTTDMMREIAYVNINPQIIINESEDSLCVQSIFNLLDICKKWLTKSLLDQSKHILINKQQQLNINLQYNYVIYPDDTIKLTNNTAKVIDDKIHNGFYSKVLFSIQALLHSIPLELQARAAFRINADSRSLQCIERLISQKSLFHNLSNQNNSSNNMAIIDEYNLNRSIDILTRLEDSDAIKGCLNMKYMYSYDCNSKDKINEYELNDEWMNALLEYSQIDQCNNEIKTFVDKGRLRCLMELGHLDVVIEQTSGYTQNPQNCKYNSIPLGIEASWKLSQWDQLDNFLIDSTITSTAHSADDLFRINIGKAFSFMKNENYLNFHNVIKESRIQVMSTLSASCQESYSRTYPSLVKLHILHELENSIELKNEVNPKEIILSWHWDNRLEMMSQSIRQQSNTLAVQRTVLSLYNINDLLSSHWLNTCQKMRKLRRYDASMLALYQAKRYNLSQSISLIEECKILKESGQSSKALILIEPVEVDVLSIRQLWLNHVKNGTTLPEYLNTPEKRLYFSEKLHLATEILVENKQKLGQIIINRYKCVIDLKENRNMSKIHYDIAKYYDELYLSSLSSHEATYFSSIDNIGYNKQNSISTSNSFSSDRSGSNLSGFVSGGNYLYLLKMIDHYHKCLLSDDMYLLQALPRLLTVWLAYTSLRDSGIITDNKRKSSKDNTSAAITTGSSLIDNQNDCNNFMNKISTRITTRSWYSVLSQLVSRTGHNNIETLKLIKKLIIHINIDFPLQSIWFISGLMNSLNSNRKEIGLNIFETVCKHLNSKQRIDEFTSIKTTAALGVKLIEVAVFQTKDKKMNFPIQKSLFSNCKILLPTQTMLLNININGNPFYIHEILNEVNVASSKAKPKTITIRTNTNQLIKFLAKQERNGDLRKDAHMMEFNNVINRIFTTSYEGRLRHLRLRTFAVICLNEECGILEWVDNTACIRHLINESHNYYETLATNSNINYPIAVDASQYNPNILYPPINFREIHQPYLDMQKKYEYDIVGLVNEYRQVISSKYRPCLHRWFLESFQDPTEWYENRMIFIRSLGVWSIVGYIIGLGDRHTENILCDVTNGEIVHVDFDCLFDKGLQLLRPEIIPFRLTPNLIDVMGFSGVEGIYKQTLEVAMSLLQENKAILMSILEPFLRDPTVAWSRSGRAQQLSQTSLNNKSKIEFSDLENKDAKDTLSKIQGRLNGMYNMIHPYGHNIQKVYKQRKEPVPQRGLGALPDEIFPLSIPGLVVRLIEEATCEENLAQLYVGWQPWS